MGVGVGVNWRENLVRVRRWWCGLATRVRQRRGWYLPTCAVPTATYPPLRSRRRWLEMGSMSTHVGAVESVAASATPRSSWKPPGCLRQPLWRRPNKAKARAKKGENANANANANANTNTTAGRGWRPAVYYCSYYCNPGGAPLSRLPPAHAAAAGPPSEGPFASSLSRPSARER